jgi:site-specific DNA recombinase
VGIEPPGEGVVHPIVDGMRAVLDAEQLEDLKRHTRRGMRGRIQAGLSAGVLIYGYAPGQDKGKLLLVEHEAAVVRRIFTEYAHGRSPRAIAEGLNADDIRPPRGRGRQASAINGNRVRPAPVP